MKAVIFDMDGLLIDSEPFWQSAEREVFGSLGIEVTEVHSSVTSRMTTREVTEYWFRLKPWEAISILDIEMKVIKRVGEHIGLHGKIMPGVMETLVYFKKAGYKIGLATNAPAILIPKVLKKLNIESYFDAVLSAESVAKGKPAPDIYVQMASDLSIDAARCIVFEDSKSGMAAAIAAGMTVVAVPARKQYDDVEFDAAHLKIGSLLDLTEDHIHDLNHRGYYNLK